VSAIYASSPCVAVIYISDNCLPARVDVHMLDPDRLLAAAPQLRQGFDLCSMGPQ
jgi:hypothetical protein